MADYIYLLENRLSPAQRAALGSIREVARSKGLTIFLVGGAVRDLTSGSPVRDLDVVVQGNALKLKKDIEKAGFTLSGEIEALQALFVRSGEGVRLEVGSTLAVTFAKPGKPVVKASSILDDLRRRDFTANAMALSLNEGSYGLLMDPLNGVADIENRELRLVSNYGFIEDPVRMIRAARFSARLGWQMEEKTQARYETGKQEGYISALQEFHRGYETEEIVHEEDPLRVMRRLESEGWLQHLAPAWGVAKANVSELERLREVQTQLQMQGIHPDPSAANFPLLTAKMSPKEVAALKSSFPRQGFVAEIEALEAEAKELAAQLGGKGAAAASQAWKLLHSAKPESLLWAAFSSKSAPLQTRLKSFYTEWPQARQKMPYVMMQEMRIVPDLPGYDDLLEKLFFELMDGRLNTPEEIKAFLEPFSPPAPPPPVHLRRARAAKKEAKPSKGRDKKTTAAAAASGATDGEPLQGDAAMPLVEPVATDGGKQDTVGAPAKSAKAVGEKRPLKSAPATTMPAHKVAAKSAPVKAPTKSTPAGVPVAVKTVAKKVAAPAAKKGGGKKPTAAKAPAKSVAPPAKKTAARKAAPVKGAVKKAAPKVAAKSPAKKAPAKPANLKKGNAGSKGGGRR